MSDKWNSGTSLVSCNSHTYVSNETDITNYYNDLSLSHTFPNNALIVEDTNAHIGKKEMINSAYTTRQTEMDDKLSFLKKKFVYRKT